MGFSSSRLLYLACAVFLAVVALLPRGEAARWIDVALAPTRVLGELASPLSWLTRGRSRAAERVLADALAPELAQSRALAEDERLFALPDEEHLISGRAFVHAQVLHRFRDAPDRVECALEEAAAPGLAPGLPVVLSNSYVGRVYAVDPARRRLTVHLVTDKDFRIGARADSADGSTPGAAMVVGGLEPASVLGTPLSVHNPDRSGNLFGLVRVDEGLNPRAPHRALSRGFRLGALEPTDAGRFRVRPELDFAQGLFRVVIVLPQESRIEHGASELDVADPENWRAARAYLACEPAAWREGLKLDLARAAGAREGSAVAAGARLVGFVSHAGALQSDVSLLGDAGVAVPAQARVEGEPAPQVLGRLLALGRAPSGALRFLWTPAQPLEPGPDGSAARRAVLFTGAGELGVPRGLLIGEALLPCGPGPHRVEIASPVDARLLRRVRVWLGRDRDSIEARSAP